MQLNAVQEVEPFFKSWKPRPYHFSDEVTRRRFVNSCQRNQGDIFLWDLVALLEQRGHHVRDKLRTRSRYSPDMLRAPLTRYEEGGVLKPFNRRAFKDAFDRVRRMFLTKGKRLRAIPLETCSFKSGTNSGLPWLQKKDDVYQDALNLAYAIRRGVAPPPMIIFHRGKSEEVARPVFGYPFSVTLLESRFFEPFQQALLASPSNPYAGGKYDFQIAGQINEIRAKSNWLLELDFSGLDGSASAYLISKAFQIISEAFEMDDRDRTDWDILVRYHIFGNVLAPDGNIYSGKNHGVSSGSMFTQVVDTILNLFGIFYAAEILKLRITRCIVLGDDGYIGVMGERPDLKMIATVMDQLSLVVNAEKSRVYDPRGEPHFLGHDWSRMVGTRPLEESLVRLCSPERNREEYWLREKEPEAYISALKERIQRYQEDNPDAFHVLQTLLADLLFPNSVGAYLVNPEQLYFTPVQELVEKERWKITPHTAREGPPGPYRTLSSYY